MIRRITSDNAVDDNDDAAAAAAAATMNLSHENQLTSSVSSSSSLPPPPPPPDAEISTSQQQQQPPTFTLRPGSAQQEHVEVVEAVVEPTATRTVTTTSITRTTGSESTVSPSVVLNDTAMIQILQTFQTLPKLSKFDVLVHVAPGTMTTTVLHTTSPVTNPSLVLVEEEYVRNLSFYNHPNPALVVVGNHRCQLICQMHLDQYCTAVQEEAEMQNKNHHHNTDDDDENDDTDKTNDKETKETTTTTATAATANVIEQIYNIIFHQHRIDEDCQRAGTFVVVLHHHNTNQDTAAAATAVTATNRETNNIDDDDDDTGITTTKTTTLAELPKLWAMEFIRQQMEQYRNIQLNSTKSGHPHSLPTTTNTATATTTATISTTEPVVSLKQHVPVAVAAAVVHSSTVVPTTTTTTETTSTNSVVVVVVDEETIKRRRRSSLLRRSVSSDDFFADHKKRAASYRRGSIVLSQLQQDTPFDDDFSTSDGSDSEIDNHADHVPLHKDDSSNDMQEMKDDTHKDSSNSSLHLDDANDWGAAPSLSRFTSSQSLLSQSSILSWNRKFKKPLPSLRMQLQNSITSEKRRPSWSEGITDVQTNHVGNVIVHTANPLDVIFMKKSNSSQHHNSTTRISLKYQLIPTQHTGNSRIMVMVQLDLAKYSDYLKLDDSQSDAVSQTLKTGSSVSVSSHSHIRQLCRDLVNAVQTNYNGRFLMEQTDTVTSINSESTAVANGKHNEYYVLLTNEQAVSAVECIFQAEKLSTELNKEAPSTEVSVDTKPIAPTENINGHNSEMIKKEAMEQLHHLSTAVSGALMPSGDESVSVDGSHMSTATASTRKSTSTTITAKMSNVQVRGGSEASTSTGSSQGEDPNINNVHKTAIMSLQQRKKRQGLLSRINQMGTSNNPSADAILGHRRDPNSQRVRSSLKSQPTSDTYLLFSSPLHSSSPAGLNYDPDDSDDQDNPSASELQLNYNDSSPSYYQSTMTSQSNPMFPPTINELSDLEPIDFGLSDVPLHQQQQVAVPRQNQSFPSQLRSQHVQNLDENQYYQLQQHQLYQQQQLYVSQQQQQQYSRRRPSALSQFSQGMIQEMLIRAHNNNQMVNESNFHDESFGSLDDLTPNVINPSAYILAPQPHHQLLQQQQQQPPWNMNGATTPQPQQYNTATPSVLHHSNRTGYTSSNENALIGITPTSSVPVSEDAAEAAAYLLGFGRAEI